jgi:antitoxin YefM
MESTAIQYVSDEQGNAVAVIVSIVLWREIASERETASLLRSGCRPGDEAPGQPAVARQ